jgi:hypothetical protein
MDTLLLSLPVLIGIPLAMALITWFEDRPSNEAPNARRFVNEAGAGGPCSNCGAQNPSNASFCNHCGEALSRSIAS